MKRTGLQVRREEGAALIGAVLVVLILSMLGTLSMTLGIQEIEAVKAAYDEAVARHLAEGGAALVMQWFHDPQSLPNGMVASLLAKRYEAATGPSFFDAYGMSQFTGTVDRPDLVYDAVLPEHDRLLNDPVVGWFRSLHTVGRILKLKVYGPAHPGFLCTVEVTTGVGNLSRTVSVQLGTRTIPPLRSAAQIGIGGTGQAPDSPLAVWAHWGDVKVKGDAHFETYQEVPVKTSLAQVSGLSYAEMAHREDRWLAIWVGGTVLFSVASSGQVPIPATVFPGRDPVPGLQEDRWDYELMKSYALLFGSYYVLGRDGLLYRNGQVEPGLGLTAEAAMESEFLGDNKGLVFVDTLDQQPLRPDNLGTLSLEPSYAEGLFVVNAHVHLKPTGNGLSVPVLSPPAEGSSSPGSRVPVQLAGIHINGVFYAAGDVVFEGAPRVYGALVTGGKVRKGSDTAGHFEAWYNHDLRSGLVQGVPLVYVAPGTWQEKY